MAGENPPAQAAVEVAEGQGMCSGLQDSGFNCQNKQKQKQGWNEITLEHQVLSACALVSKSSRSIVVTNTVLHPSFIQPKFN